jgi:hypothetical protein
LSKPSTVDVGNAFRDAVSALLRTQYPDATPEQRIGGTKVDILFSHYDFGKRITFAVECKDYANPLTKSFIAKEIRPVYQPLQDSGDVQRVLIVSRKPIGADAAEFMRDWGGASHQTFEELAESLIGLRSYIERLAQLRATEDTEYIEARLEDSLGNAIDVVDDWIRAPERCGLAILGSYGQGKTSFAKHMAGRFARKFLTDPTERMPILLRLGEVVHETQLEGLFGKEFTARYPAKGYQFSTLELLNEAGRLIVILDGFDEMKHAMTAADFRSNFAEFNRLLVDEAKVLLLGRPNALPSDERELVIRGKAKVGGQLVQSSKYAAWDERKLSFFDEAEAKRLLTSSLSGLRAKYLKAVRFMYPQGFVDTRVAEVLAQVPTDLLRRPVHLQLIAEVAADPNFDLRGFNTFKLYDHFIKAMVDRDTDQKPARRAIASNSRLTFQRDLAWWAWRRTGATQGFFSRHDIPQSLLTDLPDGHATDDEGKLNEYIVSTLTEEKETGMLYFAHRSFQEFLVAERMRLARPSPAGHEEISQFITDDVIAFLRQAPSLDYAVDWYETLPTASGILSTAYLSFFASLPNVLQHMRETTLKGDAFSLSAWPVAILYFALRSSTAGALEQDELWPILAEVVKKGQSDAAAIAALAMLGVYQRHLDPSLLPQIAGAIIERCLRASRPESSPSKTLTIHGEEADFASNWIHLRARKIFFRPEERRVAVLELDLAALEHVCAQELGPKESTGSPLNPLGDFFAPGTVAPVNLELQKVYGNIDDKLQDEHRLFLNDKRPAFFVVTVAKRLFVSSRQAVPARTSFRSK